MDTGEDVIHLGTFDEDQIISIGSLFRVNSPKLDFERQYRLRAMATDPDYRGKGAGKQLVEFALEELGKRGFRVLWCDAREKAVGFYASLGFDKLPEPYEIPRIGTHYFMWKEL